MRKEKRLGAAGDVLERVAEEVAVRNFIKHCRAEQKARHSTPFFAWVKPKKVYTRDLEQARVTI
ncbi:MAG: hypothetical protein ACTMK5_17955, partial [Pseudomonas helleri]